MDLSQTFPEHLVTSAEQGTPVSSTTVLESPRGDPHTAWPFPQVDAVRIVMRCPSGAQALRGGNPVLQAGGRPFLGMNKQSQDTSRKGGASAVGRRQGCISSTSEPPPQVGEGRQLLTAPPGPWEPCGDGRVQLEHALLQQDWRLLTLGAILQDCLCWSPCVAMCLY